MKSHGVKGPGCFWLTVGPPVFRVFVGGFLKERFLMGKSGKYIEENPDMCYRPTHVFLLEGLKVIKESIHFEPQNLKKWQGISQVSLFDVLKGNMELVTSRGEIHIIPRLFNDYLKEVMFSCQAKMPSKSLSCFDALH